MTQYFFNKSQIKMFQGVRLEVLEKRVNEFMLTTTRIYNVKHAVALDPVSNQIAYHYIMVSYEP